ncbi:glycosyltransferase [Aquipuribacter hungaricus]|uniref:Glycosyltransferase n=1 Tax=Aquipuribacter hungaricus TaxID=545624 RepID=A0ABV7WAL4_9MICO
MTEDQTGPGRPTLTVVIPARDEIERWPAVLERLRAQTLQPDQVVVADGTSTDGSREWLDRVAADDPSFVVVDNPRRVVPAALNVALAAATGDLVARMDTHADYADDYLEQVVGFLRATPGAAGVGGAMETAGRGAWGAAIASVLSRPVGLGGARHRVGGAPGPIVHVFSGCYRREQLVAAGGWDERLHANEDYEMDVRVAESGSPVHLQPAARSTWYVRRTPRALALQMWRYGYYKGLTLHLHPGSLRARQLAPPLVVLGLLLGPLVSRRGWAAGAAGYALLSGALGARAAHADGAEPWRGAVVPALVHLSWGAGLLAGLVRFAPERRRGPVPRLPVPPA